MTTTTTTFAQRYNAKARDFFPSQFDLIVDEAIDDAGHIDEIVFRRSEYLGGMADVLIELVKREA